MGIQVKFFTVDQNVGKDLSTFSPNLNFLRLPVFKILQFKLINNFLLTSVLAFCQYFDRRSTFKKLDYIYLKASNLQF